MNILVENERFSFQKRVGAKEDRQGRKKADNLKF